MNTLLSGNINGAVSSNVVRYLASHFLRYIPLNLLPHQYRTKDKPWFTLGHGLVLMYICFGILATGYYEWAVNRENQKRARGERDEVISGIDNPNSDEKNGVFENVAEAKREKGDLWSGYKYIL